MSLYVDVCLPHQQAQALELIYAMLPAKERRERVASIIKQVQLGIVDLDGLLCSWDEQELKGAMLCVRSAGRTLICWAPQFAPKINLNERVAVEESLLVGVKRLAKSMDARIAQVLLGADEQGSRPQFERGGFFQLARLLYLRRELKLPFPEPSEQIDYVTYAPNRHQEFLDTLDQSYVDSLDCPELNGVRSLDDIFESHRCQGDFNPDHWYLAKVGGETIGCLLMVGLPLFEAMEVGYIALLPAARQKHLGKELLRKGLATARDAGVKRVTLAVDDRNTPALRLYNDHQFEIWEERDALLLIVDPNDGKFIRR